MILFCVCFTPYLFQAIVTLISCSSVFSNVVVRYILMMFSTHFESLKNLSDPLCCLKLTHTAHNALPALHLFVPCRTSFLRATHIKCALKIHLAGSAHHSVESGEGKSSSLDSYSYLCLLLCLLVSFLTFFFPYFALFLHPPLTQLHALIFSIFSGGNKALFCLCQCLCMWTWKNWTYTPKCTFFSVSSKSIN